MRRFLRSVWLAFTAVPALVYLDPLIQSVALAALAALIWVVGWWRLGRALEHDPRAEQLRELFNGRIGAVAVVFAAGVAEACGLLISVGMAALWLLAASGWLIWSWSRVGGVAVLRQRITGAILALAATGACLGVGELIFRSAPVVAKTGGGTPGGNRWAELHYDRLWTNNPLSLRSLHLGPKPAGVTRIVVLGDSFTWGYYVAQTADVWTYVMERQLNAAGQRIEVINLGKNGASTVDELQRLDDLGWLFQPDMIVLQYTLNDPITGPYADYFRSWPLVPGLNGFLDQNSYLFSFVNGQWQSIQHRYRNPTAENELFREDFRGWKESRNAMSRLAETAREHHVPVLLALFPLFVPGPMDSTSYRFHQAHRAVMGAAEAAGLPAVDLGPLFWAQKRSGPSWWGVPNDPHPGVEAHRLIGEALAREVEAQLPPLRRSNK
ncbi:MAG: SGNH/GDSL hydrolase family protein [Gemmatimonadota bacterium]